MMKNIKRILTVVLSFIIVFGLTACSSKSETANTPAENKDTKNIIFGVAPGPYGDMVKEAIAPYLEKKGYKVNLKEFSDYVQPNLALGNKEIDVNLFQHTAYLEKFSKDSNLDLSALIAVPTAGMAVFSNNITSLNDIKEGAQVGIPNDASNLARALQVLEGAGIVKIKADIDQTKASTKDVVENPKKLKFVEVDAAQLPRSLDSVDIAVVNGNFGIAAGLDFSKALLLEKLKENYKNIVAVRTEDLNSTLSKDIKEAVESSDFKNVIEDPNEIFKSFDKPEWYINAAK
jgi:D-methionine transport system substrate-binding protein